MSGLDGRGQTRGGADGPGIEMVECDGLTAEWVGGCEEKVEHFDELGWRRPRNFPG